MDISAKVSTLTSDSGSDNLVPAVSSSAEERRSSDVGWSSADNRLPENGEIMSEIISDNLMTDENIDQFCVKSNMSGSSSSLTCEKNTVRSVEDKIITDGRAVVKDDNSHVVQVSGTNVTADSAKDDDDENADSRSQTPLQDELEPEVDNLNQNQAAGTADTELDSSMRVNPMHDFRGECTDMPASTSTAVQSFGEENGEISDDGDDDDDDEGALGNQVNSDSVSQQVHDNVKLLKEEKPTKELESQKVFFVCCLFNHSCIFVSVILVLRALMLD